MKKFVKEFKEFALKGNVIDLAVGVIIGAAFKDIVTSLVEDIITPLIGGIVTLIAGENLAEDFSGFALKVGREEVYYGKFISAVLSFLLMALIIFLFVKMINKFKTIAVQEQPGEPASDKTCPHCKSKIDKAATRCPFCTSEINSHKT